MVDRIDIHLGRRLRARRQLLGFSQRQVAEACGVTFQQIQKYESGRSGLSAAQLWRISRFIDAPIGYFFDGLTPEPALVESKPTPRRKTGGA